MSEVVYCGPTDQVVPEMTAQDDVGGTLILRPGQRYSFAGVPPGDPAWWVPAPKKAAPPAPVPASTVPPATAAPAQEG